MSSGEPASPAAKGRSLLLILGGLAVLVLALALLLFGQDLFSGDNAEATGTEQGLQQIPAFSATESGDGNPAGQGAPLPEVGGPAPDFTLVDLDGNAVSLSDLRGRPVVMNFWATWCAPCRLEMPELEATQRYYQDQDVVVLAVNQEESVEQVRAFHEELGLTMTTVLDSEGDVANAYGAFFLPSTVFINPEGDITAFHRGIISRSQIDNYMLATLPLSTQ